MQSRTNSYGWTNTCDSFDLLSAVVDWVEEGEAPGDVVASREGPKPASFALIQSIRITLVGMSLCR